MKYSFIVPYSYPRRLSYRSYKRRDDNKDARQKRRITAYLSNKLYRYEASRYNYFKSNARIKQNFSSVSYKRWYN